MDFRDQTACFTGHRAIARDDLPKLTKHLDMVIEELTEQGIVFFGSGFARGFDSMAAQAVLKVRNRNPAVKLIAVLPCFHQEALWSEQEKQRYYYLLDSADKITYVSESPYYDGCMKKRNIHLVMYSSVLVAYLKHGRSGTSQTVRIAREHGIRVINLSGVL